MTKRVQTRLFRVTADVPLPPDTFDQADVIARLRDHVVTFTAAILDAQGEVTSGIVFPRGTKIFSCSAEESRHG